MATKTEKNVQLKINKMTKNIFDQLSVQGLISEDELYLLSDDETGSATWGTIGGELSNQTDLKIMLDSKADKSEISGIVTVVGDNGEIYNNLSAIHLTQYEYYQLMLLSELKPNCLYILDKDNYIDAFYKQIKNLSDPTDLSDAATKWYVDNAVSSQSIDPAVLSAYALSSDVDARLSQKADKSEIPTVNNPTITITQGDAVKGSFTLNQASAQTISLDAGGGGGGDIPADLSCSTLKVGKAVELGVNVDSTSSGAFGAIAQGQGSSATGNGAIALGINSEATAQLAYAIGSYAKARSKNSVVVSLHNSVVGQFSDNGTNTFSFYLGSNPTNVDSALESIYLNGTQLKHAFPGANIYDLVGSGTQTGSDISPYIDTSYLISDAGFAVFQIKTSGLIYATFYDVLGNSQRQIEFEFGQEANTRIITLPVRFDYGISFSGNDMELRTLFAIGFNNKKEY